MTDCYDVAIIGAGPAGATCAWYLARRGIRVLLLEKKAFPRDKLCGDAICSRALMHLERMGVLRQILDNDEGHPADVGGMISPSGIGYVGSSAQLLGGSPVIAIKRIFLDARIAHAASTAGATLVERHPVADARFDPALGEWTILRDGGGPAHQARVLVVADGALSRLGRRLGLVDGPPDAVCSRTYMRARTTAFDADGMVFYPRRLLPGYCALFREARDEVNFAMYIIPGGECTLRDLRPLHDGLLRDDPHLSKAIGPRPEMDEMKAAPLRLGGIAKSYGDHLLILGDAAGQIDPLTGEGIQYAMDAAELAAETLAEALAANDLGEASLKRYDDRWRQAFGRDFRWSERFARFYLRHPAFLDAGAATLRRRGNAYLARWGQIMTGAKPKRDFLKPDMLLPVLMEWMRLGRTG
ncbi:MAG TPA: FAD-dependent oxidoreductase [Stellaceae bacterium]|nr:FAD-dependent oxidoreductase [Stellaceae bacterium]